MMDVKYNELPEDMDAAVKKRQRAEHARSLVEKWMFEVEARKRTFLDVENEAYDNNDTMQHLIEFVDLFNKGEIQPANSASTKEVESLKARIKELEETVESMADDMKTVQEERQSIYDSSVSKNDEINNLRTLLADEASKRTNAEENAFDSERECGRYRDDIKALVKTFKIVISHGG